MRRAKPAAWLVVGALAACAPSGPGSDSEENRAALHRAAIVVDTHSDTTPRFQDPEWRFDVEHPPEEGHMDLPRIERGGLDVQFWAIYVGRAEGEGKAIRRAVERIDAVYDMAARYADRTEIAYSTADVKRIVASGKLASLMGLEGGHIIEDSLAALRTFHRLGVRYMTLTHSFHTNWADSSGTNEVPEPLHGGLTPFGREVVREMNRLGMMVDVSHVSDGTFWDVLEASEVPVIASHSSCRALADHPRNLSDEMLRALARNGGVAMINFYPGYIDASIRDAARALALRLRPRIDALRAQYGGDAVGLRRATRSLYRENPFPTTSLGVLIDHLDHAIKVAGPDHVGLGSDWDGVPSMPVGMEDVSKLPAITSALLDRDHTRETVLKILGGNILRVMREVERHAPRAASTAKRPL
jgi:membrane dipeptidase